MRQEDTFTFFEGCSFFSIPLLFHLFTSTLPRMVRATGTAVWLSAIWGSVLSFGYFYLFYLLVRLGDGKSLTGITNQVLGPFFSKIANGFVFFYLLLVCHTDLMEAVELLAFNTYGHTRIFFLAAAIAITTLILIQYPSKGFARIASISVIAFYISLIFILFAGIELYDPSYLYPIFGFGARSILHTGFLELSDFDGLLIMLIFVEHFGSVKNFRKTGFWTLLVVNAFFLISAFCYTIASPYQSSLKDLSGILDLSQNIYISRFFQRFESIFIIFISLGKILLITLTALAMKKLFNESFSVPTKHHNAVTIPLMLLIFGATQLSTNVVLLGNAAQNILRYQSTYILIIFVGLLLLVGYLRGMGKSKRLPRAVCLLLTFSLCIPLLTGCNAIAEPDEEVFAIVMGYDRSETETVRITFKVMPEDKASAGGSGGDSESTGSGVADNIFTVDAPSNLAAADLINTVLPKHLSLLHVKMLVISEELAREDLGLLMGSIMEYNEIKPNIAVIICEGSAQEFISAQTTELIPFLPLETEMVLKRKKGNASYLVQSMNKIYDTYLSDTGDPLIMYAGLTMDAKARKEMDQAPKNSNNQDGTPQPGTSPPEETIGMGGMTSGQVSKEKQGGGIDEAVKTEELPSTQQSMQRTPKQGVVQDSDTAPIFRDDPNHGYLNGYLPGEVPLTTAVEAQIVGMAVVEDSRMVGTLNSRETAIFMLADGSFSGAALAVPDPYKPDYYVVYYANTRKPNQVQSYIDDNGKAHISLECFAQLELSIVHNTEVDYNDAREREKLEAYTAKYLEDEVSQLITKLQQEYNSDALRVGRHVAKNFRTIPEWEAYNWRECYKDAEIDVTVNLKM